MNELQNIPKAHATADKILSLKGGTARNNYGYGVKIGQIFQTNILKSQNPKAVLITAVMPIEGLTINLQFTRAFPQGLLRKRAVFRSGAKLTDKLRQTTNCSVN